jgi:hypothetical protein
MERYCSHLNERIELDTKNRFYNILNLIVCEWMVHFFNANVAEIDTECQEERLELKYDKENK